MMVVTIWEGPTDKKVGEVYYFDSKNRGRYLIPGERAYDKDAKTYQMRGYVMDALDQFRTAVGKNTDVFVIIGELWPPNTYWCTIKRFDADNPEDLKEIKKLADAAGQKAWPDGMKPPGIRPP